MNWRISVILAAALTALPLVNIYAQDDADQTNDVPVTPLKELMAANNTFTNTVGIVLVKISPGLWAGKFETIQDAYQKITRENPSAFKDPQKPVDSVSWNAATDFCAKLTARETAAKQLPDGYSYTLPTQDQWMQLMGDASLNDAVMKLNNQNCSSTATVGSLGANNLGLYDTRGNVMEWCLDCPDVSNRVLKGGAWDTFAEASARPVFRWFAKPDEAKNSFGFRVILSSTPQ